MRAAIFLALCLALATGCFRMPEQNGLLGTTHEQAVEGGRRMEKNPATLRRPVVVLNGYHGLSTLSARIAHKLAAMTSGDEQDFLAISFTFDSHFDDMAAAATEQINRRWPSEVPGETIEVDVVGISMGGLVARWAAISPDQRSRTGPTPIPNVPPESRRLRIARLFTMGTPHRGAVMADLFTPDAAARDMEQGSAFLNTLDEHLPTAGYELVCYAQMRDYLSGATRCAPAGHTPIWTSGKLFFSHLSLADNPIFLTDIAKRLRGDDSHLVPADPPPHN